MKSIDRLGQVFGDFTVIKRLENNRDASHHVASHWLLKCNYCGAEVEKYSFNLHQVSTCKCKRKREQDPLCKYNSGVLCKEQDKCDTCGWYKQYLRENE